MNRQTSSAVVAASMSALLMRSNGDVWIPIFFGHFTAGSDLLISFYPSLPPAVVVDIDLRRFLFTFAVRWSLSAAMPLRFANQEPGTNAEIQVRGQVVFVFVCQEEVR